MAFVKNTKKTHTKIARKGLRRGAIGGGSKRIGGKRRGEKGCPPSTGLGTSCVVARCALLCIVVVAFAAVAVAVCFLRLLCGCFLARSCSVRFNNNSKSSNNNNHYNNSNSIASHSIPIHFVSLRSVSVRFSSGPAHCPPATLEFIDFSTDPLGVIVVIVCIFNFSRPFPPHNLLCPAGVGATS